MLQCNKCQVNKHERLKVGVLLHLLDIPQGKWESISMDFITGLPKTSRGNDSVWVVVDRLTKMAKFIATKKTVKTPELEKLFIEHLYKLYGLPTDIVSDRDWKFISHFWREIFKKLNTTLSMSTADHSESDGQTKRGNQILEDMLRSYVTKKQSNWEEYLPLLEFAYNSSKHLATGSFSLAAIMINSTSNDIKKLNSYKDCTNLEIILVITFWVGILQILFSLINIGKYLSKFL